MEKKNFWKSARTNSDLSQEKVAKSLGYTSAQFVSNWERGIANPPTKSLKQIIKLYGLDPEIVIDHVSEKHRTELELAIYGGKGARSKKRKGVSSQKERTMP
jgi:transcriptional regulator with XRE-family HTH domain